VAGRARRSIAVGTTAAVVVVGACVLGGCEAAAAIVAGPGGEGIAVVVGGVGRVFLGLLPE